MSSPGDEADVTLPPRKPNTPRTWLLKAKDWCEDHPDWLLAFFLGFVAGAVLL